MALSAQSYGSLFSQLDRVYATSLRIRQSVLSEWGETHCQVEDNQGAKEPAVRDLGLPLPRNLMAESHSTVSHPVGQFASIWGWAISFASRSP